MRNSVSTVTETAFGLEPPPRESPVPVFDENGPSWDTGWLPLGSDLEGALERGANPTTSRESPGGPPAVESIVARVARVAEEAAAISADASHAASVLLEKNDSRTDRRTLLAIVAVLDDLATAAWAVLFNAGFDDAEVERILATMREVLDDG